ncbi:MAG: response regulator [Candidatus Lokiarchaeota archaeon]|nr:response regulator [Candidatus Lokiarchaeota archaeon]
MWKVNKSSYSILVVDDEPDIVELARRLLEMENYRVIVAYDGEEALDKVNSEKIDLILLDIRIPKINGYEICKIIKDEFGKKIKIIMFTVKVKEKDRRKSVKVGADDYFIKPFNGESLINVINKYLDDK